MSGMTDDTSTPETSTPDVEGAPEDTLTEEAQAAEWAKVHAESARLHKKALAEKARR